MWNYNNLLPTLMMLLVIYMFYITSPRLPIRSRYSFVGMMIIEIVTMGVDMTASKIDEHFKNYSLGVVYWVNILYFVLFFIRVLMYFLLTLNMLGYNVSSRKSLCISLSIIHLMFQGIVISTYWTNAMFKITDKGYVKGPYYNILYIHALFFLLVTLVMMVVGKSKSSSRRKIVVGVSVGIMILAYFIRMLFPEYLVMDMFYMISILIAYLEFENPEFYLNSKTGLFHSDSMAILIDEWNEVTKYKIVSFIIRGYSKNREAYGTAQIDKALAQISIFLKKEFKGKQCFYLRDGKFAVITRKDDVNDIIKKVKDRFESAWYAEKTEMFLDVGFAIYDSEFNKSSNFIMEALRDSLNEASVQGRGIVKISRKTMDKISRLSAVKVALEKAMDDYSVDVFFQPVVSTEDFKVVGAEALVRIYDGVIGEISPEEFIPIAEKKGNITRLGHQVFEKACNFYSKYGEKMGLKWININVSPVQFKNRNLLMDFERILSKYNINPNKICLEITEKNVIDADILKNTMEKFVEKGFRFSLDDYGSGYSNAISLLTYPLSNIKVDKEIVNSYFKNRTDLLESEVKILKGMEMTITAEGVETKEMAEKLKELGCNYLQGFYFSKPLSIEEFVERYNLKK